MTISRENPKETKTGSSAKSSTVNLTLDHLGLNPRFHGETLFRQAIPEVTIYNHLSPI